MAGRLHHLDWIRMLLVMAVAYAHTCMSGIGDKSGINSGWVLDDRGLHDVHSFRRALCAGNGEPHAFHGEAPAAVRWVSVVRPWCIPLLFWVSGAAMACSYRGGMPRGTGKLAVIALVGVGSNALLWFLGPQDDTCVVGHADCKGPLLNFTIVLYAGSIFPVLFQMWYVVVLFSYCFLCWPLFAAMHGLETPRPASRVGGSHGFVAGVVGKLATQWLLNMAATATLVLGSSSPAPWQVVSQLAALEAAYLFLVAMACVASAHALPGGGGFGWQGQWIPLRALHYLMAVVAVLQFGAVPYAKEMDTIGFAYVSYIFTGSRRFFDLGFIMTKARGVQPLLSNCWPMVLVLLMFCSPSTNWNLAGMLTYPFFAKARDRCLYVSNAVVIAFIVDNVGRSSAGCRPLPAFAVWGACLVYVFHPVGITLCLQAGQRDVTTVWAITVGSCMLAAAFCRVLWRSYKVVLASREEEGADLLTGSTCASSNGGAPSLRKAVC